MESLWPLIRHECLYGLFYPGSHDAGAYSMRSKLLSCLLKTQNLDFIGQFEAGIRSFDLRVGDKGPQY